MSNVKLYEKWFEENVLENQEDFLNIGKLATKALHEKIMINMNEKPKLAIAIYGAVWDSIIDVLNSKRDSHDEYSINISNRIEISFSNHEDENEEKEGNFMIHFKHLDSSKFIDSLDEEEDDTTLTLCAKWNAANVIANPSAIQAISSKAIEKILELAGTRLSNAEIVIPMFTIIHEQLIGYLKLKRVEMNADFFELNVFGIFTLRIEDFGDGEDPVIDYIPSISTKLALKDDAKAQRME